MLDTFKVPLIVIVSAPPLKNNVCPLSKVCAELTTMLPAPSSVDFDTTVGFAADASIPTPLTVIPC